MGTYLIYTCGYPFSGKSTLARAIATATVFALVEVDAHMTSNDRWLDAYIAAYAEVKKVLSSGRSVVLDSVAHTHKNRHRLHRIATECDAHPVCVWLDIPATEANRRRLVNQTNPTRAHVPEQSFEQIVAEFQPPDHVGTVLRYQATDPAITWVASNLLPVITREVVAR
ncbi:MAG TPA: AAA family ATPase [Thermomicrobiales bacterium]|nr:AAA family ATPase [Thermomicrobiales bacterium]